MVCQQEGSEEKIEIDARTSDSIALAVRFNCPVYTYEFILANAGIVLDDDPNFSSDLEEELEIKEIEDEDEISIIPRDELEKKLDHAISNEDYEEASKIRDELNRRK